MEESIIAEKDDLLLIGLDTFHLESITIDEEIDLLKKTEEKYIEILRLEFQKRIDILQLKKQNEPKN